MPLSSSRIRHCDAPGLNRPRLSGSVVRYGWLFALTAFSTGSLATPIHSHWSDMRVKHAWNEVPKSWELVGHPAAETVINLYIALKPERENALIDALYEVSDPSHPKYGAHMSREQVAGVVAPHPNTLELINSWLEHHGVPSSSVSTSHGGGWLTVTGVPVSQANDLLGTSYQLYQHAETKDRVLRTLGYALPAVLHGHVQTVAPTTHFGSPQTLRKAPRKRSGEAVTGGLAKVLSGRDEGDITPSTLRSRYGTQGYVPAAADRNVLGIVGQYGEYPSQGDLATFMGTYRTDGVDATFTLRQAGSGNLPGGASSESNLEIQYTQAITYPTQHVYYTTISDLRFLLWLDAMIGLPDVPQTISTSYSDDEQDFPREYAGAVCPLFAQLGLRGASVISSSGDVGVGGGNCMANDGSGRIRFLPQFPASCPWLTSVGGTILNWEGNEAASYSSGGFSVYFPRPPYQASAVFRFLREFNDRLDGLYNPSGRGFPDISAQSQVFKYIFRGEAETQWGTGCSASTVAAVISLLNDFQISKGRRPLGWLNPWLYDRGEAGFDDITSGSNPGCGSRGFLAIRGWDPITGFGTPYFSTLVSILESMARERDSD